jgi:hypothetical protein
MHFKIRSWSLVATAACCAALSIAGCHSVAAAAQSTSFRDAGFEPTKQTGDKRYFVEFHARPGHLLGHTIVVFGRIDSRGRPAESRYGGLYPDDGQAGLIVGSVLPVDASVRTVKEDISEPATIVYRRKINLSEYRALETAFRRERKSEDYWHLLFFNCNDFAARLAESIGLRTPSTILLPKYFVAMLRDLNGG